MTTDQCSKVPDTVQRIVDIHIRIVDDLLQRVSENQRVKGEANAAAEMKLVHGALTYSMRRLIQFIDLARRNQVPVPFVVTDVMNRAEAAITRYGAD